MSVQDQLAEALMKTLNAMYEYHAMAGIYGEQEDIPAAKYAVDALAAYESIKDDDSENEVTDAEIDAAMDACTSGVGRNCAYFPPETVNEWRAAILSARKARKEQ